MNIFVLDLDPAKAAAAHCDKHVTKMCLEYAQLLCTAARVKGINRRTLYNATHTNHPCAIWTRASRGNVLWLALLLHQLGREHELRFERSHKSSSVGLAAAQQMLLKTHFDQRELTPFVQAMPDQYKQRNAVKAYRAYYLGEKKAIARWAHGPTPRWWKE